MAVVNRRHAGGLSEFKLQLASRSSAPRLRPPRLKAQLRTRSGFAEVKWRGGWSEMSEATLPRAVAEIRFPRKPLLPATTTEDS